MDIPSDVTNHLDRAQYMSKYSGITEFGIVVRRTTSSLATQSETAIRACVK